MYIKKDNKTLTNSEAKELFKTGGTSVVRKGVYVIVDSSRKNRLRDPLTGKCFPCFEYTSSALKFINKYLNSSQYAYIKKVGGD